MLNIGICLYIYGSIMDNLASRVQRIRATKLTSLMREFKLLRKRVICADRCLTLILQSWQYCLDGVRCSRKRFETWGISSLVRSFGVVAELKQRGGYFMQMFE